MHAEIAEPWEACRTLCLRRMAIPKTLRFLRDIITITYQKLMLNPKVNGCTFELGKSKMGNKE